jgi:hypothetical protein
VITWFSRQPCEKCLAKLLPSCYRLRQTEACWLASLKALLAESQHCNPQPTDFKSSQIITFEMQLVFFTYISPSSCYIPLCSLLIYYIFWSRYPLSASSEHVSIFSLLPHPLHFLHTLSYPSWSLQYQHLICPISSSQSALRKFHSSDTNK